MPGDVENKDLEVRIIEAAKSSFIEKGFSETSMSEIAAKVGINRPGLHYYFRTKDKMFEAVFGAIIQSIIPKIQDIILRKDEPISKRIENIIDTYYSVFRENPCLPLFILREMQRDVDNLLGTINVLQAQQALDKLRISLQEEMKQGKLKPVPMRFIFFTFYSLLIYPFLTKNLSTHVLLEKGETFENILTEWKPYIVSQMENLLCVPTESYTD